MKEVLKTHLGNQWHVYIVECADGTLYTGYTNNVFKRVNQHNTSSRGAKYTFPRRPVKLVHYESYPTKVEAMKREYAIKQLSREQKIIYINGCGNKPGKFRDKRKYT